MTWVSHYQNDGVAVLENFLPDQVLAALRDECDELARLNNLQSQDIVDQGCVIGMSNG